MNASRGDAGLDEQRRKVKASRVQGKRANGSRGAQPSVHKRQTAVFGRDLSFHSLIYQYTHTSDDQRVHQVQEDPLELASEHDGG